MFKLLTALGLFAQIQAAHGQSFSFNCRKDTTIPCTIPCITLKTTIPDIHASTNSYTVNQISALSCFRPYISPSAPGPSANLTIDDRYSPQIDITFPFSFFGSAYTKLIASTNGYISFDTSKKLSFSHFGILRNSNTLSATTGIPEDLPSLLYDKALIMGPYHDLDPNNSTSAQQIKYDVVGTAPYRKWILSYYNVPLYTTACLNLATNTHQIVLYETLGIVEILIFDKEICLNWNKGRAMIGMQSINKISAIMAPGRQATSAPWGNKGMNESWRFTPSSGSSLFKKVELYDLSGAFVTTGVATKTGNNFDVSFNPVCPPGFGATYIVKSFYQNPGNSASDIIATDTINVSRGEPVIVNISSARCNIGSMGSVTVTSPTGAGYEYSIDGINWQTSNVFTLAVGNYTVYTRIAGSSCVSTKMFSIDYAPLSASILIMPTACSGPPSGSITIFPANGTAPYLYSLNGNPYQNSNVFSNLAFGNYTLDVKDVYGCTFSTTVFINTVSPVFTANVTNTLCGTTSAGSISISILSGVAPYSYSIDGGPFQSSNVFDNLIAGTYSITVKDATTCSSTLSVIVNSDVTFITNLSFNMPSCNGNSNGSITVSPSGISPFQYAINGNAYQSNNIFNNLSAGPYILHIKDSLGCVKDSAVNLLQPNVLKISNITTSATSCATPDGQITIKANGGTTPYIYSIDKGNNFQTNNFFITKSGTYSVLVKDSNGCITTGSAVVQALNNDLALELGPDKTLCYGDSISLVSTTTPQADYFRWSPTLGLSDSTSGNPAASPADTIKYFLIAKSGYCQRIDSITVNVLHKPIVNAGADTTICYNSYAVLKGVASNLSGSVNYAWLPANEMVSPNSSTTTVWPKEIRPHTYRFQVTDNYGCNFKIFDDVTVIMNPPVPAFAGNDTVASFGVPHQLNGSGGISYIWTPANVLDKPFAQNPIAILKADTKFNLTVKDTLGCIGTSSVLVKVFKGSTYYIPNAFTPNGDGLNDIFRGVAPGIEQTFYFRIYNRLGQLLFESRNVNNGWDGKFQGIPQPPAVYVWIIKGLDVFGNIIDLKGTVTLIR